MFSPLYILPNTLFYLYTQTTGPSGDNDPSTAGSGDNDPSTAGSGDDICTNAPKDWCADGDDKCDDACDKGSDIRCTKDERKRLGCVVTSTSADGVAAVKKLRRRKA